MVDTTQVHTDSVDADMDFLTLLEESFAVEQPVRGDIVTGVVLSIDNMGMLVDLGMKRDGVVPRNDMEKLGDEATFTVGAEIPVMIVRTEDEDGNMIVSVAQAKQNEDWLRAEELMNSEEIWDGEVADANRGGLIVPFGNLRGFVPASHVTNLPRGLNEEERTEFLTAMIGQPISVKVIEVNRRRRRLVLSQREAQRELRDANKDELLSALAEGETRKGIVSGLRDFGAFVDLGGADGLIHISELAWHRVKHPREVLRVGQEVEVYVDEERKRIGLSLRRLSPEPWTVVEERYEVGQVLTAQITRLAAFGAFAKMDDSIEGLIHISEMADHRINHPKEIVQEGDEVQVRVIRIDPQHRRIGLSLRQASEDAYVDWQAEVEEADEEAELAPEDAVSEGLPVEKI